MSVYDILELTLKQILPVIKPLRNDFVTRLQIIDEFRAVVESVESLRGATVEPFGSFICNLFSRWGDLDISIELPNGSYISSAGKKRKQNLLGEVLRALRGKGGWRKLQLISNAKVPIVKCESIYQNISCDISINNLTGQMKSKFLFWISEIDERFRDMVLLVKEWAKAHDINDSRNGTFSSYSLCLLVIFHFQTCVPAILPPLKEIYSGNISDDLTGVRVLAERRIAETSAANIARFKSDRSRILNRSSLAELFISFLAKFSDIDSISLDHGVSPYTGQWELISSNMRWLPRTYALYIEDPFEQPGNAARAVSNRELARISDVFKTTHRRLNAANQNRSYLVATLVRPQISQFVLGTPVTNPTSSGSSFRTRPQLNRTVQTPSQFQPAQVQRQFQNMRLESRPTENFTAQRPVQPVQTQSQRVWRPRSNR
ncbi:hypothetical protein L1049_011177 [Liquidambar formosana]|uniref:Poly(A) RNA polymerase mitochondrial-like central palm domain-containing protein n=1 Tax=Liquidambar formosana TaxID=63359 RepID=A0AAP0WXX7_LIQFO